ncbi:hypothetical protein [Chryseobacterium sp. FH1]|uniref:hypothetical protein n=1 Tax=Chryseobacterium sp. FH1 TaxID=1233951 RepID=UPI0004E43168|nr:hypothetical protein [Chryseobacterium sp. FH1]KFC24044.1 hypothetical protein IO90_01680 [Chryseobacterium sp. FH1]
MKYKILILLLLIFNLSFAQNDLDKTEIENIQKLINLFKTKNIDGISKVITYPLNREYPIPSVKNEADLKKRFNQIFDKTIIDEISNSKIDQWSEVGWRGIMLNNGDLWIDSDGKITALNYQSHFELTQKKNIILNDKSKLHSSLKIFKSPTYKIQTKSYLIRIDELANEKYRYASWKIGKSEASKPDLVLTNGTVRMEGSGGNHTIIFKKGEYNYKIYRGIIGEKGAPEISLTVEKNEKQILYQSGKLLE